MAEGERKDYKTVVGFIQFDVEGRTVAEKAVRSFTVRSAGGTGGLVSLTVWPSHADVPLEKGDLVIAEGSFSQTTKDTENGPRTYNNLSVINLVRFPGNRGTKPDTVNTGSSAAASADEPF